MPESDALNLPAYGLDDIHSSCRDEWFTPAGHLLALNHGNDDRMVGDRFLVNGVVNPYLEIPQGMNAPACPEQPNARRYNFAFRAGRLIRSDGGFLPAPVPHRSAAGAGRTRRAAGRFWRRRDRIKLVSRSFAALAGEIAPIGSPARSASRSCARAASRSTRPFSPVPAQLGRSGVHQVRPGQAFRMGLGERGHDTSTLLHDATCARRHLARDQRRRGLSTLVPRTAFSSRARSRHRERALRPLEAGGRTRSS
jgi:hypothetical protein